MNRRRALTKAEWNELYERQGGMCGICREPLDDDPKLGPTEDDHTVPRVLNGGEEIDNRRLVHKSCHALKTFEFHPDAPLLGSDIKMAAKADRQRRAHEEGRGRKRRGRKLQGRPFEGWRNFKGEIVRKGDD